MISLIPVAMKTKPVNSLCDMVNNSQKFCFPAATVATMTALKSGCFLRHRHSGPTGGNMNTSLSRNSDYKLIDFHPTYENVHALLAEIHLYVFGRNGVLIENQAIRRDKVVVAMTDEELRNAKIILAPSLEETADGPINLSRARGHRIYEAELRLESGQSSYVLPPVPEAIWRWWLVHSLWKNVRPISGKNTG